MRLFPYLFTIFRSPALLFVSYRPLKRIVSFTLLLLAESISRSQRERLVRAHICFSLRRACRLARYRSRRQEMSIWFWIPINHLTGHAEMSSNRVFCEYSPTSCLALIYRPASVMTLACADVGAVHVAWQDDEKLSRLHLHTLVPMRAVQTYASEFLKAKIEVRARE
eukprot:6180535-Pleurochrysis_carterae.AAC.2